MKLWEIYDEELELPVGYLFYYEREKRFYIELPTSVNEWTAPLILSSLVKRGQYSANEDVSLRWVRNRIVPPDRQNLGQILKDNHLEEYDEYKLLEISRGRCAQDFCCIRPLAEKDLPDEIRERLQKSVKDAIVSKDYIIVFFMDGKVKKYNQWNYFKRVSFYAYALANLDVLKQMKISPGGHGLEWLGNIFIPYNMLYEDGEDINITYEDFVLFATANTLCTPEAVELMGCSRQNIDSLVKRGRLSPIKSTAKNSIFLKKDVMKYKTN